MTNATGPMRESALRQQVEAAERALTHSATQLVTVDRERLALQGSRLQRELEVASLSPYLAQTSRMASESRMVAAAAGAGPAGFAMPYAGAGAAYGTVPPADTWASPMTSSTAPSAASAPPAPPTPPSMQLACASTAMPQYHSQSRGAAAFAARHLATLATSGAASSDPSTPLAASLDALRSHLETIRAPPSSPPPRCTLPASDGQASATGAVPPPQLAVVEVPATPPFSAWPSKPSHDTAAAETPSHSMIYAQPLSAARMATSPLVSQIATEQARAAVGKSHESPL